MKKLAVIVSGWHFPHLFFKQIAEQQIPEGWGVDLFCVSHRHPRYSAEEKLNIIPALGWSYRETLDRLLYAKIAMPEDIEALGWNYKEYPNLIGDWGNTNQWLEEHDYREYDMLLISHDDNLILTNTLYTDLIANDPSWLILTNSIGSPLPLRTRLTQLRAPINVRGSFEFMKREALDLIGGKFDLSTTTLTREGEVYSDLETTTLKDWNNTVRPLKKVFEQKGMTGAIHALSKYYRVSKYCIEGERGFISLSQKEYRKNEDAGLAALQQEFKKDSSS